ncbi:MAG TPA: caspase family protein, partial [Thiotrichaceae bacterium]|nr:caspase family protein [Thiotrichaceae bacterium]
MLNNILKNKLLFFLGLTIFTTLGCSTVTNPKNESPSKEETPAHVEAEEVKSDLSDTLCKLTSSQCELQPSAETQNSKPIDCWHNPTEGNVFILAMGSEMGRTEEKRLKWANEDALSFANFMREVFGIRDDNQVCILPNVSKTQFEQALEHLSHKVDSNDLVIIYYSGHGTQGEDGGEIDEEDGYDELFVAYSENINDSTSQLRDDDFSKRVAKIPADNILIVIDACFSAGLTRGETSNERVKYWDNPKLKKGTPPFGASLDPIEEKEVALLSAALESQFAVE